MIEPNPSSSSSTYSGSVVAGALGAGIGVGLLMHKWLFSASRHSAPSKLAPSRVGVGIGVLVCDVESGEFLVGLRKGSHGEGQWSLPGGWLERGEGFVECALRELEEETNLSPRDVSKAKILNRAPSNNLEFGSASVFVTCELLPSARENVKICEPNKCFEWRWIHGPDDLPEGANLFFPLQFLLENHLAALPKNV